ncbi:MAG TPA: hypothetical protein DCL61_08685 [Cyanobacteria bacterium UBA12227]|nr:hypothetical protein [Cyanobacteria bacterium UBA12227]
MANSSSLLKWTEIIMPVSFNSDLAPFSITHLTPPPTPPLRGEGSKISGSPFPCREGGWGVRFFDLLRLVQDLSFN